ncbi:peptidase M48 Ste24p [Ectothiorhodospiraceae bacterium BW-2]|nr:peptidase M48 Ste24p [Ectothiorhodospiraceae bacterium BW-2]
MPLNINSLSIRSSMVSSRPLWMTLLFILLLSAIAPSHAFRGRASQQLEASAEELEEDVKAEIAFGRQLAALILGRHPLDQRQQINRYLTMVGRYLTEHGGRSELTYRVALVDSEEINAYAAPGGYIFITRGALLQMEDEAELAAVLAHEIAHINHKHIVKELKIRGNTLDAGSMVGQLLGGFSDTARVALQQTLDKAFGLLFGNGLKQQDELEADQSGMLLSTLAGYDPKALERYLQKVSHHKEDQAAILNQTHPSFSVRLEALQQQRQQQRLDQIEGVTMRPRFTLIVSPNLSE